MTYLRDEILVAYADAQLRGEELRSVQRQIANDSGAQRSILLFKLTGQYVRQVFAEIDFSGAPSRLAANIERPQRRHVLAKLPSKVSPRGRLNSWHLGVPLAASIFLAVGVGIGARWHESSIGSHPATTLGVVSPTAYQALAIEKANHTGVEWTAPDGTRVVDIADFKDRFGNLCRELELYTPANQEIPAELIVACRTGAGNWSIVGAVSTAAATQSGHSFYVPSEDQARSSLDSVLSMLGAQQRTSAAERKYPTP